MRSSVPSTIFTVLILFLSLIVLPIYFISIIDWRDDMNTVQTASRNFVDKVIDTGHITDDMVADMNLQLASCSSTFTWTIYKEAKVTNPDPAHPGQTITTWEYTECDFDTEFATGDIIEIEVDQVTINLFQRISATMLGANYNNRQCRLAGMVR